MLGKLDSSTEKNQTHLFTPCTKTNSKWIKDLNVRPETKKYLQKNIGSTLMRRKSYQYFLDMSPQARQLGEKPREASWASGSLAQ